MFKGPLSFRLVIYSVSAYLLTALVAHLFAPLSAFLGLAGVLLSVAAVTCGIYELKNTPQQKELSMLGVSLGATLVLLVVIFMALGASQPARNKDSQSRREKYRGSEYE